jgi:acyl transferase domain-containing protein
MSDQNEYAETDIAIVGIAGRFPGADDVDALWQRVVAGDDCLTDVSVDAARAAGALESDLRDPDYVRRSGMLADVAGFDHEFFGIGSRDADVMDPQHRHFLECAWAALEMSTNLPETFDGAIGVFGGCGMNTYLVNNLLTAPGVLDNMGWFLLRHTGNDKDFLVNNVAYRLDLHGPAVNVQTACSTSLVAVHLAVQSLLSFECDLALAGGATIEVPHGVGYTYHEGEILSPDGHCRAFDEESAGTVLTSGVGMVALRRLEDAVEAGDPVLAIVKASAINNDGARKVGFLAPSVDGHADVVREALTVADIRADEIQLVEAHGTGTAVGDPIEVAALTEAFRSSSDANGFCRLTSTKPNIGHLDTAAGAASLIKVVQALRHRTLPPMANHTAPSPLVDWERSPFLVSETAAEWPADRPRRAGISSLGVGGTNAHVLVEEAPTPAPTPPSIPEQTLALSAMSKGSVEGAAQQLADHLERNPEVELADVAHTLITGRRAMPQRRVVTVGSREEAIALLRKPDRHRSFNAQQPEDGAQLGFMFPGGGSQYRGMGAGLDARFATFHETRTLGASIVRDLGGPDLIPGFELGDDDERLRLPSISLPSVFVTSVALARQWMAFGAQPDVLLGHSLGEYVAAHLADVISLEDALTLVVKRSQLMEQVGGPDTAMLVVPLDEERVVSMLPDSLSLATINAADECVVAGQADDVDAFAEALRAIEASPIKVPLAAAAHSYLLDPVLDEFRSVVRTVSLSDPKIPYPSNLTGTWITPTTGSTTCVAPSGSSTVSRPSAPSARRY